MDRVTFHHKKTLKMHNMVNQKIIAKFALEKSIVYKKIFGPPYPPPKKKIPSRRSRVLNLELQADIM